MTISLDPLSPLTGVNNVSAAAKSGSAAFASLLTAQLSADSMNETDSAGLYSMPMYTEMASLFGSLDTEDDLKSALMTFCMMMSTGTSGTAMGAAMSSLSAALSGTSGTQLESLRYGMLTSDFSRDVLTRANNTLFFNSASESVTPYDASKAVTPSVVSSPGARSAAMYRHVIDQFNVENNPRYMVNKNGDNDTYCNIFLWDVTRAMNAEIPHYVDPQTLEARTYPDVSGARELNANGIYDWLAQKGSEYGWARVSAEQAQQYANRGMPVVTAWKNETGAHGHVQVVCPSEDGRYDASRGVTIAQAGRRLTSYTPIKSIYSERLKDVVYYAHA
jgi:hypothetical protein